MLIEYFSIRNDSAEPGKGLLYSTAHYDDAKRSLDHFKQKHPDQKIVAYKHQIKPSNMGPQFTKKPLYGQQQEEVTESKKMDYKSLETMVKSKNGALIPDGRNGKHPRDLHQGKPLSLERDGGRTSVYRWDDEHTSTLIGHINEDLTMGLATIGGIIAGAKLNDWLKKRQEEKLKKENPMATNKAKLQEEWSGGAGAHVMSDDGEVKRRATKADAANPKLTIHHLDEYGETTHKWNHAKQKFVPVQGRNFTTESVELEEAVSDFHNKLKELGYKKQDSESTPGLKKSWWRHSSGDHPHPVAHLAKSLGHHISDTWKKDLGQTPSETVHPETGNRTSYQTNGTLYVSEPKKNTAGKTSRRNRDAGLDESVELDEGRMSDLHLSLQDHMDKHIKTYKRFGGAEALMGHADTAAKNIAKAYNIEYKHAKKFVNGYIEDNLHESIKGTTHEFLGFSSQDELSKWANKWKSKIKASGEKLAAHQAASNASGDPIDKKRLNAARKKMDEDFMQQISENMQKYHEGKKRWLQSALAKTQNEEKKQALKDRLEYHDLMLNKYHKTPNKE